MNEKRCNPSKKLILWKALDILVSVLPLLCLCAIQYSHYFGKKTKNGLDNTIGIVALIIYIVFFTLSKGKTIRNATNENKKSSIKFLIFWIIICLLKDLLNEMILIGGMITLGMLISDFWTTPMIKKWARIKDKTETATINADAMRQVFKDYAKKNEVELNERG